jgi:hypothetical protein
MVLFEGKPEFEIRSEVGISKKMFLSDQLWELWYWVFCTVVGNHLLACARPMFNLRVFVTSPTTWFS